ncbi:MAG: 8-oxoguanine DNA glycosylase, N-terminal domain-containing protein, partial [Verrucomicrobiota bacterium]|nr:8-oxoguanine DNA glycosylase, N-terminal domain-containing protein [Verrucomicrobiota bacterium]
MTSPRLERIAAADFNLEQTLHCGQVFHWKKSGNGFAGAIDATPFFVEQVGDQLLVPAGAQKMARTYFALDHPLREIYDSFPNDPAMTAALEFCRGMRVIRQPVWECLATFITSALK